jgi:hypothetical protein
MARDNYIIFRIVEISKGCFFSKAELLEGEWLNVSRS